MLKTTPVNLIIISDFSTTTKLRTTQKRQCHPAHLITTKMTMHTRQCTKHWESWTLRSIYAARQPHCTLTTRTGPSATLNKLKHNNNSKWCSKCNSGVQCHRLITTHQKEGSFSSHIMWWASRIIFTMEITEQGSETSWIWLAWARNNLLLMTSIRW